MGDHDGKMWSLPFSHVDPVVSVELSVTLYELDSGGRGAQFTLLSKHPGGRTMAVRLPEELAARLALKVLATLDGDPACCRELEELRHPARLGEVDITPDPMLAQCQCDLIDTSTAVEPSYVRGRSNGCLRHPSERDQRDAAARRKARE